MPTTTIPRKQIAYEQATGPGRAASVDLSQRVVTTLISMIGTLIVTGLIAMISLYTRVATLTDNVQIVQQQVQRSIDHSVDRDEYLRRDTQVQAALDRMATKDELKVLQHQLDEQTESLKVIEGAVSSRVHSVR